MTGIERLRLLAKGLENPSLNKVLDYLETRTDMYDRYLNEEKTPEQMWDYITKRAKEQSIKNCAVIDERVVYVWALSYFLAKNDALGLTTKEVAKPESKVPKENKKEKKTTKNDVVDFKATEETKQISMFQEV